LSNQRKDLRPIDLLLRQLQQQSIRNKQSQIEEQIDKQYEMLREGRREEMIKRTKMSEIKTDDTKSNIIEDLKKKTTDKKSPLVKPITKPITKPIIKKEKIDFKKQAEIEYNKNLQQQRIYCFNGAMTACDYVSKKNETINNISKKLEEQYNKKNSKTIDKKPTTSDFLIDPETERIVKNPIVSRLEQQEKLKGKEEVIKASDAYKLGQEMKQRESKMYHPEPTIKIGYDVPDVKGTTTI
jgi:hypothetical protein